jgi:hypothetical protein
LTTKKHTKWAAAACVDGSAEARPKPGKASSPDQHSTNLVSLSAGPVQQILQFLTPKDAASLAKTSRHMRNHVESNKCEIYFEGVFTLNYPKAAGNAWYDNNRVTTKPGALKKAKELQEDPKVTETVIRHSYADIGFIANWSEWEIRWNRPEAGSASPETGDAQSEHPVCKKRRLN